MAESLPGRRAVVEELARLQRDDSPRLLAVLARRFGDLDLAEDVAQDAYEAALATWPRTGIPDSPLAWLLTTARRKALDRLRRDAAQTRRLAELAVEEDRRPGPTPLSEIPDDRLELFFTCCHPTLRPEEQVALILRFLGGLTTVEVAAAFLVSVPTMQARLTRAKKRIRITRIPVAVPPPDLVAERLPAVLHAIYSIYTEGYATTGAEVHIRTELTGEAIRLARTVRALVPADPEVSGLVALLVLTEARAPARVDGEGLPVSLEDQDRTRWRSDLLAEGIVLAEQAAHQAGESAALGPFVIQASIAAVHAEATRFDLTDWAQIAALYDLLDLVAPSPIVRLNRAVAIGRRDGFEAGLRELDRLAATPELARHHPFHAARAVTLEELGRPADAALAWRTAAECTDSPVERAYISKRLREHGRDDVADSAP